MYAAAESMHAHHPLVTTIEIQTLSPPAPFTLVVLPAVCATLLEEFQHLTAKLKLHI